MHETLEYLYSLERFGIKLGLDVMHQLMDILDHPEQRLRSIHVTGTNGKGSTCAFLASVLRTAGYKVGLYTSPHLVRFNERIKVDGVDISDDDLIRLTTLIRGKLDGIEPTFFEFTTALAFLYFAEKKVDIAVIEVGMGGRLDATNVVVPEVSVITHVALDHTEYLGKTLLDIAREKAGIVKKGVPLVTAETNPEALDVFRKVCAEKKSELFVVQDLLHAQSLADGKFSVTGKVSGTFFLSLPGNHQITNACTALVALSVIKTKFPIPARALQDGLATAEWPGRLMVVSEKPMVVLDGAHNVDGMRVLSEYVGTLPRRKTLMIGIAQDKDAAAMVKLIVPLFENVIVTQGNFKPMDAEALARVVRKHCSNVTVVLSSAEAFEKARAAVRGNELLLVTGSLYLVGDVIRLLEKTYSLLR